MSNEITAETILASLRHEYESTETFKGEEWGTVYLDNVRPAGITAHQFAGFLSALEAKGLYRPYTCSEYRGIFGRVLMAKD